jgi:hypothetical protein
VRIRATLPGAGTIVVRTGATARVSAAPIGRRARLQDQGLTPGSMGDGPVVWTVFRRLAEGFPKWPWAVLERS